MSQNYGIKVHLVNSNEMNVYYPTITTSLATLQGEIEVLKEFTGIERLEVFLFDDDLKKKFFMHEWTRPEPKQGDI